jgi:pyruvate dehydrogenase E1 component alpha subunit
MTIHSVSYLSEEGILKTQPKHLLSEKELIKLMRVMLFTQNLDERMLTLQRQGLITFAMSSRGEEGCIVASAAALSSEDWIFPQYREQGALFWRGYPTQDYLHHMFTNSKDITKGRQMPNHFGSREHNVVTVSSPLATQIPQAAGCAYGMKLSKQESVTLCYFGEGTTSKADFHTGINFAAVKYAPCIFFCRNNHYAISTNSKDQFVSDGIAPRGEGYGITAMRFDGNDVFAVYDCVKQARELCLQGKGPVLLEAMTYRIGAHSTSDDPSVYRQDKEVEDWKTKDPITRLRKYLISNKLWTLKEEENYLATVKKEIDAAISVAKTTPAPADETLINDVYFSVPSTLVEQLEEAQGKLSVEVSKNV